MTRNELPPATNSEAASVRLGCATAIESSEASCAIHIQGLHKRYGQRLAVADLNLRVLRGETLGLLGPNGAGKSTTMLLLAGVLKPDAGKIELSVEPGAAPRPLSECRKLIGLAPQGSSLYPDLSAEENLRFFARLYGLSGKRLCERIEHSLEQVALSSRRHDRVRTFSGGMVRRLNIACALVHEPSTLR